MSAIAAIFNRDGAAVDRSDIDRVTRALTPYGGDFQRASGLGDAALGCTLNYFTPEDLGKPQPVLGGEGRFAMVFDGRIDNREEVGAALGLSAADLGRFSDPQLAMRSFERWGEAAFLKWIADFALIVWDSASHRLLLARDPIGRQGLLYHVTDRRFVASTMPAGLHALPEVPYAIDEVRMADALSQLMTETRRTYFAGISSVQAGHVMEVTRGGITERRYYDHRPFIGKVHYARDDDYVEAARELFDTAVKARLRRTGKIGAFMSGGLDSSSVAVTAAAMLKPQVARLPTFTWVPQDDWDGRAQANTYGDETPYVRAIAESSPEIELNLVQAVGRAHYHRQDEYLRLSGMPMRNAMMMGWFHTILEHAQQRGLKVMLGGEWGNNTLSYNGLGVFYEHWRSGHWGRLAKELWRRERGIGGMARGFYSLVLSGLLSDAGWDGVQKLRGKPRFAERQRRFSPINPEFAEATGVAARAQEADFDYWGRPRVARRDFWHWMIDRVHGNFGQWLPAIQAMHRIDLRDPFSDRRLIEWTLGVPETQFYRDGAPRWLMRRMMRGVLPNLVLDKTLHIGRANSDWQVRLQHDLPRMRADLQAMRGDPDMMRMVDVARLESWLEDWPAETVIDADDERSYDLSYYLPMTLQAARFVQLVKGSNA